jgi:RNA polymerase sigma factor (sigma-70 family)
MNEPFDTLPECTLTQDEERNLFREWRRTKNDEVLVKLVLNNMRQAVLYARRICREQFEDGELISVCYSAMLRQARRYNPNRRLSFFTFAKIGVRGDVNRYFRQLDTVKMSKRVSVPDWGEGINRKVEYVDNESAQTPQTRDDARFILRSIRRCCSEREQVMFALTYFGCLGFNETARLLGISRSAVQAMHRRSLEKVRGDCRLTERLLDNESACSRFGNQVRSGS